MPPAVTTGDQFKLSNLPTDTVSAVHFQPGKGAQFLLASSWDCMVHLYDVTSGGQRSSYEHACPVLASCFADALHAISGSLEGTVKYFDLNSSQGMFLCLLNFHSARAMLQSSWLLVDSELDCLRVSVYP